MNRKVLWKIEELWNKHYTSDEVFVIDISKNYNENSISKYYSRFKKVNEFDFTASKKTVFEDIYGEYLGLENCQVLENNGKLIYLFDNHNEMIYPMVEISKITGKKYGIVHIDAHPDDAEFQSDKIKDLNIEDTGKYIDQTRISDFFDAVSEINLIGEIFQVTHSDSLEFFLPPDNSYILSLDIDIFGPEGNFAELKDKVRAIALAWNSAEAVCIAMSPGFIDQEFSKEIINIFTSRS